MKGCINCDFKNISDKEKTEIATAIWESLEKMGKNPKDIHIPGAENFLDFVKDREYSKEVQIT